MIDREMVAALEKGISAVTSEVGAPDWRTLYRHRHKDFRSHRRQDYS
jgi:predicted ATP-binding protein involved in virulence